MEYAPLFELFTLYAVDNRVQAFEDFQVLETAALEIFSKKAERRRKESEAKAKRNKRR